jgi:hypothetical protein
MTAQLAATVTLSDTAWREIACPPATPCATFANAAVGTVKPVTVSGFAVTGIDAGNYTAYTTANTTATSPLSPSPPWSGPTTRSMTAPRRHHSHPLTQRRGRQRQRQPQRCTASFASKTAALGKTVTVSGLSLSGTDAGNYQLASSTSTATADITARSLTVSATGANKVYDGTTSATITLADNRISGDSLTTSYTNASFANKNVGTAKTVSVNGIMIAGTDAANYSVNTTATAAGGHHRSLFDCQRHRALIRPMTARPAPR